MRVELAFGVGMDSSGKPLNPEFVKLKLEWLTVIAANKFGGFMLIEGNGGWRAPSGVIVREPGRILLIDGITPQALPLVYDFAALIRDTLLQDCVLVNCYAVESRFV